MNYIALTIGPIYKTLANCKKPSELYSSSFVFSYIMKQIIKEFKSRKFIIPYIKDDSIFDDSLDIGLFHDRFIFESQERDKELLEETIDKVLKILSIDLDVEYQFLKNYFQINYVDENIDENPIEKLTPYLDTAELQLNISQYEENLLQKQLKAKDNFFLKNRTKKIDSLTKIASDNYIAIVHADADSMGEAIKDKSNIANISKQLFEYCKSSHDIITSFGGQTIFAGGDDLLFFAPIVN